MLSIILTVILSIIGIAQIISAYRQKWGSSRVFVVFAWVSIALMYAWYAALTNMGD